MEKQLFTPTNNDNHGDRSWVVRTFFNSAYAQGKFLWALPLILEKTSCGVNEDFCFFPDLAGPDILLHFSGVGFSVMHDEVVVTEAECSAHVERSCQLYLERHPADRAAVEQLLAASALERSNGAAKATEIGARKTALPAGAER